MKLSIKDINYKDFLINHAEKLIFGFVIVIAAWALWSTSWDGYSKQPQEFQQSVDREELALKESPWPDKNTELYENQKDIRKIAEKLIPIESEKTTLMSEQLANFEYSTEFDFPLVQEKEPIEEAELYAMEDPIVGSGVFVMGVGVKKDDLNSGNIDLLTPDIEPGKKKPGRFRINNGTGSGNKPNGGTGIMPTEQDPGNLVDDGQMNNNKKKALVNKGEGKRFNSIRMIVPLRKYYESYAKAMHKTVPEIRNELNFVELEVQRKTAIAGPDPWAGKWEDIDLDNSEKVLDSCAGYDEDSFSYDITDFFTMVLPMRLMGSWKPWASHPRIDHYHLSPEAKEIQKRIASWRQKNKDRIASENTEIEIKKSSVRRRRAGGGGRTRGLAGGLDGDARDDMINDLAKEMNNSANGRNRKVNRKDIEARLSAAGQLLLFRYFDFDIKPGKIYRYRARLEVQNPNYNKPVELVIRPSVADGLYRPTPWSQPTPPVLVPQDIKYYIASISTPPKNIDHPTARFDIFQWRADSGTIAHNQLEVKQGEFLSRMTKTYILKPGAPSFLEEAIKLGPDEDVLVDIDNTNYVQPISKKTMLADLKLPEGQKGVGTIDQILVVDQYGRLVPKNPAGDNYGLSTNKKYISERDAELKDLKEQPASSDEGMKDGAGGLSDFAEMMEDPEGGNNRRKKRR